MRIEDQASDLEIVQREEAEQAIRRKVPRGYGPPECRECGEEIPDARRAMGYSTCVPCQEQIEKLQRF